MNDHLVDIASQFQITGEITAIEPITIGHINDTYVANAIEGDQHPKRYILQKINSFVFKDPLGLQDNIQKITQHLRRKIIEAGGDPDRETLNLIPGKEGMPYSTDQAGNIWRMYSYIENAHTYEAIENLDQVYKTGWAFGNFQCLLADFPAEQLHETIPNFHNTSTRFQGFCIALQQDPHKRAAVVHEEIDFILKREAETRTVTQMLETGKLPLRVTHNDSKLNNLMIDDRTGKGICIIDLDTVMPGSVLYDFGDMVRSITATAAEDEPNWQQAGISLPIFEKLVHGYLDAARDFLTSAEIDYLAFSGRLITLEQTIRFLGDYLNGDVYYKISRPEHNLDRARTQIAMLADMETKYDQMRTIVDHYK